MSDKELRRDEDALKAILAELDHGTIKVYRNVLRQPYIICDHPGFPAMHSHLLDKDTRCWLTHFIWKKKEFLLKHREVDRILEELAGRSLSNLLDKIHDSALLHYIESEPVVAVLLEFMHTIAQRETTMDALWKDLKAFAKSRGLLVLNKKCFPGGANVLSRKLGTLVRILQQLGISITTKRSNGCQVTLSRPLDDSPNEPSKESSPPNASSNQGLSPKDDKDKRILRLQQRKQQNERKNNE